MAKILLVEDDNNLREIFEMRLQAEGYETVTASDGEEALVVAMKQKPDLIIADVMMPKLSGFEMLETLRAAPDMANVKVIMMTALGQAEDRQRGENLGVVKYLVKSQVTLEDFVRVVRDVMGPGDADDSSGTPAPTTSTNKGSEMSMPPGDNQTPTNSDMPAGGGGAAPANPMAENGQMGANDAQDQGQMGQPAAPSDPAMPAADPSMPADQGAAQPPADQGAPAPGDSDTTTMPNPPGPQPPVEEPAPENPPTPPPASM